MSNLGALPPLMFRDDGGAGPSGPSPASELLHTPRPQALGLLGSSTVVPITEPRVPPGGEGTATDSIGSSETRHGVVQGVCRICQEGGDVEAADGQLGSPLVLLDCGCTGDLAVVHLSCAIAWFATRPKVCEVCDRKVGELFVDPDAPVHAISITRGAVPRENPYVGESMSEDITSCGDCVWRFCGTHKFGRGCWCLAVFVLVGVAVVLYLLVHYLMTIDPSPSHAMAPPPPKMANSSRKLLWKD